MLRAARTAKRGGSLCATTAQSITQWNYAVWAATPPSRRVGYLTSSLWLRRPAGACGGLRGRLPAAGATDLLLRRSFGAAIAGRDFGGCLLLLGPSVPAVEAAKDLRRTYEGPPVCCGARTGWVMVWHSSSPIMLLYLGQDSEHLTEVQITACIWCHEQRRAGRLAREQSVI